jgi:hypothetical protein
MTNGDIAPLFLALALDGDIRSASGPGHFTSKERTSGTLWIGGWVSPRASLDAVDTEKSLVPAGNRILVVQPVGIQTELFRRLVIN